MGKSSMVSRTAPAIRRNWGYWDGVSARERNRRPEWNTSYTAYRQRHPFDQAYGEGFWIGWYDEEPPRGAVIKV